MCEEENNSDYLYITFELAATQTKEEEPPTTKKRWILRPELIDKLRKEVIQILNKREQWMTDTPTPEELMECITEACDNILSKKFAGKRWTQEIADLHKACVKLRRRIIRIHKKRNANEWQKPKDEDNGVRKKIKEEEGKAWKELIQEVESEVWGLSYKIVTKKVAGRQNAQLTDSKQLDIARELFPNHAETDHK